jgi:hypothetical protein
MAASHEGLSSMELVSMVDPKLTISQEKPEGQICYYQSQKLNTILNEFHLHSHYLFPKNVLNIFFACPQYFKRTLPKMFPY